MEVKGKLNSKNCEWGIIMSHTQTLILNRIREAMEKLQREGVGYIEKWVKKNCTDKRSGTAYAEI